jgi:NitT/TauT family transport system substrate-binding protein
MSTPLSCRRWIAAFAILALATLGAPRQQPVSADDVEQTSVAVPVVATFLAPIYIAQDAGLWSKLGLNVAIRLVAGPGATNALIAGSVDFASGSGPTLLRANVNGQPIQAIAALQDKLITEVVASKSALAKRSVSPTSSFAERGRALKGMTIAVDSINGLSHTYLRYVMQKVGLNPESDATVTVMEPTNMLAALQSGTIDAFVFVNPTTSLAVRTGNASILIREPAQDTPEINPYDQTVITTRSAVCAERRTVCTKFIAGLKSATQIMIKDPHRAAAILKARFPELPDDVIVSSLKEATDAATSSLIVEERALKNVEDFSVRAGILTPNANIDPLTKVFSNSFNN